MDVLVTRRSTVGLLHRTVEALWRRVLASPCGLIAVDAARSLPGMTERRAAAIVNVRPRPGASGRADRPRLRAKGGVLGFTSARGRTAATASPSNAVAPGPFVTPLLVAAPEQLGDLGEPIVETSRLDGLRRLGQPDEVAAAIAPASRRPSYVTGQRSA